MSTVVVCISCSMMVESEVFCDCGALRPENASHLLVDGGIDPGGFPIFLIFILFFSHGGQTYYFHILFVIHRDLQNPPLYQPARHSVVGKYLAASSLQPCGDFVSETHQGNIFDKHGGWGLVERHEASWNVARPRGMSRGLVERHPR